ncbi:uncharacterized protein DUF4230 [Krasilnikovia cinnamomea]|uniref:Uncharacterized protein DUF4230 n=1 Tax=Krasilnikovia cinnamomea TaxID=349313 RepID=A0A4Q7ZM56_9ACTN|nr:DUF4230 domain-containing protein [Krasilnikovia cinnamomea]RZU51704.1 uncharacterized protein DUF4230 [Krasilnikovia cinnamomea]
MAERRDIDDPTKEYPAYEPGRAEPRGPDQARPTGAGPDPAEPGPGVAGPTGSGAAWPDPPVGRSGLARLLIFTGAVFAVLVAACLGLRAVNVLPSFDNPFSDRTTDRSQPVLLQSMRDLSRYVAADGTFQVIVDLQEHRENVPDFLLNQRTLFVGSGTVEAYVDFGTLGGDAVTVDNAAKSVRVTLPAPQLAPAALDLERSYVVAQERGLLNRIGDAFREDPDAQHRVYAEAQRRITEAAQGSGLDRRARENAEKMLTSLFGRLGYTSVTVTFANP